MSGPKTCPPPTYVMYANDIMVFYKGSKRNIAALMNLFQEYAIASGQLLSLGKCKYYTGSMAVSRILQLNAFLGFSVGRLPFTYLGVPIFKGKPKAIHLKPIVDKIKTKLASWKGALLSVMGRFQLVKSIIHVMLVYSFHVYAWPVSLLKTLDKWIRNFIWSGYIFSGKLVPIA